MSPLTLNSVTPLPESDLTIPTIGFGVYLSVGEACIASCSAALKLGYRHIDTAQYYANELEVGQAVRNSGIPRKDIYVTTKIMEPVDDNYEATLASVRASVEKIGLGYVDLFLIHSPTSGPAGRKIMWTALEKLKAEGGTKSIGVSNFGVEHIEQLKEYSTTIPAVNQIEIHPWCQQTPIIEYCQKRGIIVQAYAPLVRATKNDDPTLVAIAKAHGVSTTQVLVRWSLQRGFVPLPKSDNPERIKNNADVFGFELTEDEMAQINAKSLPAGEGAICPYLVNVP